MRVFVCVCVHARVCVCEVCARYVAQRLSLRVCVLQAPASFVMVVSAIYLRLLRIAKHTDASTSAHSDAWYWRVFSRCRAIFHRLLIVCIGACAKLVVMVFVQLLVLLNRHTHTCTHTCTQTQNTHTHTHTHTHRTDRHRYIHIHMDTLCWPVDKLSLFLVFVSTTVPNQTLLDSVTVVFLGVLLLLPSARHRTSLVVFLWMMVRLFGETEEEERWKGEV